MDAIHFFLRSPLVETLGWSLVYFLWQGALIGVTGWLILRVACKATPAVRYLLACGLMLCCAAAPVATFLELKQPAQHNRAASTYQPAPLTDNAPVRKPGVPVVDPEWLVFSAGQNNGPALRGTHDFLRTLVDQIVPWTVPAWFLGILLLAPHLFADWCRTQSWRRSALPVGNPEVVALFSRLACRFPAGGRVGLLLCETIPGPLTLGWLKPVILLPAQILTGLSKIQVEAILAHEMAHIRRYDYLANLLQSTVEIVLFYHPVTWWLGRRIREIREECCDEEAMRVCPARLAYAQALVSLAENRLAMESAMAATGGSLFTRISRLLGRTGTEPAPGGKNAAWLLAAASLLVGALGMSNSTKLLGADAGASPTTQEILDAMMGNFKTVDALKFKVFKKVEIYGTAGQDTGKSYINTLDYAGKGGCFKYTFSQITTDATASNDVYTRAFDGRVSNFLQKSNGGLFIAPSKGRDQYLSTNQGFFEPFAFLLAKENDGTLNGSLIFPTVGDYKEASIWKTFAKQLKDAMPAKYMGEDTLCVTIPGGVMPWRNRKTTFKVYLSKKSGYYPIAYERIADDGSFHFVYNVTHLQFVHPPGSTETVVYPDEATLVKYLGKSTDPIIKATIKVDNVFLNPKEEEKWEIDPALAKFIDDSTVNPPTIKNASAPPAS